MKNLFVFILLAVIFASCTSGSKRRADKYSGQINRDNILVGSGAENLATKADSNYIVKLATNGIAYRAVTSNKFLYQEVDPQTYIDIRYKTVLLHDSEKGLFFIRY